MPDPERAVDMAAVLDRIGGDEDLLKELVGLYLDDEHQLLAQIAEAIAAGDGEALRRSAHTLKGAVSNFCAARAQAAAQAVEDAGRAHRLDAAPALVAALHAELSQVRAALLPHRP